MFSRLESFQDAMIRGIATSTLRERFRFTRNEKSRLVALTKISEATKSLERLVQTSILGNLSDQHRPPRRKAHKDRLRRMSEPLYRRFADKLMTACDTHRSHEARLCLWNCCSQQRQERASDSYDLVVSVEDVGAAGSHWQESVILIPPAE